MKYCQGLNVRIISGLSSYLNMNLPVKFRILLFLSIIGLVLIWIPIHVDIGSETYILGGHVWYSGNNGMLVATIFSLLSTLFFIVTPVIYLRILRMLYEPEEAEDEEKEIITLEIEK